MTWLNDVIERGRSLLFRSQQERDLTEELQFHLDQEVSARVRAGEHPDAARRSARQQLGGLEQQKEAVRDARGVRPFEELAADIRYAARGLRRNPGFTITAVLVLGLGIGATASVFSIMYSVVIAPISYEDPDRLMVVVEKNSPTNRWNLSTADATAIREQQHSFSEWGALNRGEVEMSGLGTPERLVMGRASAGVYRATGITAAVGRVIEARDEAESAPPVVVVSHALAVRRLGGAEQALGKEFNIDGVSHQVIGVLPPERTEVAGLQAVAWRALKLPSPTRRGPFWLLGIGRLKPGVSMDAAAADLAGISRKLLPAWPDFRDSIAKLTPMPLRELVVGTAGRQVGLFAGGVLLVLLLAITNVAMLVLLRASGREAEVGVRITLGANRGRIARLLIVENLLLTLTAAAFGLAVAAAGITLGARLLPNLPRIQDVAFDWRVVAFAIATALVAALLVSLSPVLTLSRQAGTALRGDERRAGTNRQTTMVRSALVVAEFALALPLLMGAGLLLNSFLRLQRVDPGFDPVGMVALRVALPAARYPSPESVRLFWTLVEQRLSENAAVTASGIASNIPPDNGNGSNNFNLVDHPVPEGAAEPTSPWFAATSGYFTALGVPIIAGRNFEPADTTDQRVIVSASWARRFFPGEEAVGRQLISGGCYDCPRTTIIGVVADVKALGLAGAEEVVYTPLVPGFRTMHIVARSRESSAESLRMLRGIVQSLDAELPVVEFIIAEKLRNGLDDPRRWTTVLMAFAGTGVLLAALGIFGLMSYVVRQRRREIGVRLALGAQPNSVSRLIVLRGMRYAALGSAIGLAITLVLAGRIEALLFDVHARDGMTIVSVTALLLLIALTACWLAGRRAAQIRPLEAISGE